MRSSWCAAELDRRAAASRCTCSTPTPMRTEPPGGPPRRGPTACSPGVRVGESGWLPSPSVAQTISTAIPCLDRRGDQPAGKPRLSSSGRAASTTSRRTGRRGSIGCAGPPLGVAPPHDGGCPGADVGERRRLVSANRVNACLPSSPQTSRVTSGSLSAMTSRACGSRRCPARRSPAAACGVTTEWWRNSSGRGSGR